MSRLYYPPEEQSALSSGKKKKADLKNEAEKIAKLIPAEVIAGYSGLTSFALLVKSEPVRPWLLWGAFGACLVLTPIYLSWTADPGKPKRIHLVLSTLAFPIWAYLTSGSSLVPTLYDPAIAGFLALGYSLVTAPIPLKR